MSNSSRQPKAKLTKADSYVDLQGYAHALSSLDRAELTLVNRLIALAQTSLPQPEFRRAWMKSMLEMADLRGLPRANVSAGLPYRIGADLNSRLMITQGLARPADYRDELELLIRDRFRTKREFCNATGLSEDMLSHVLSKRKHLAVDTLAAALARIGYGLHIVPLAEMTVGDSSIPS